MYNVQCTPDSYRDHNAQFTKQEESMKWNCSSDGFEFGNWVPTKVARMEQPDGT
ncbi:MAG: hypothetical protein ABI763_16500 [Bacteroidota bacterium]